jgi:Na+-translocating ferredoxin:NAD+ oxidoreductase subunit G
MKTIGKSAITLGVVAFLSAFFLSHVMKATYPEIIKQEKEKQKNALAMVLPGFEVGKKQTEKINGKEIVYWVGVKKADTKDGKEDISTRGVAYITSKSGYSGDVVSMVGVDESGKILGISIMEQLETPGLGARCIEIASKLTFVGFLMGREVKDEPTTAWFQEQYKGLNVLKKIKILKKGDWNAGMRDELLKLNSISAITGATITSRTVTRSLENGIPILKKVFKNETAVKEEK